MPTQTLWERDEQTLGKHLVLKSYLDAWFPILGRWHGRLLFVDGFSGPGEYADGELGSPLIALECVDQHKQEGRLQDVEAVLLFIESDESRASHLEDAIARRRGRPDVTCQVMHGEFDQHMGELLDLIEEQNAALAPAFVMIDPLGIKGSSMNLIGRVLANERSECMISFMYEPIRRFHKELGFREPLNDLFGTQDWQKCLSMDEGEKKKQYLHRLFKAQLKNHGAKHVVFFELWRGQRHVYTIYFASGSSKGCDVMKRAIWKANPSGDYRVRGYAGRQALLFEPTTDALADQLQEKFGHKTVSVEDVEEFVMSDMTLFHAGQLRKDTLRPLEKQGRIEVLRADGQRGFPSGKGIKIRFL